MSCDQVPPAGPVMSETAWGGVAECAFPSICISHVYATTSPIIPQHKMPLQSALSLSPLIAHLQHLSSNVQSGFESESDTLCEACCVLISTPHLDCRNVVNLIFVLWRQAVNHPLVENKCLAAGIYTETHSSSFSLGQQGFFLLRLGAKWTFRFWDGKTGC